MSYHQLTSGERYMLAAFRKQGLNQSQMARALGRHRSTVCREFRRNCARFDGHYRPVKHRSAPTGADHARAATAASHLRTSPQSRSSCAGSGVLNK